jgi:hypothetical protein
MQIDGLELLVFLSEDPDYEPPTLEYCESYAAQQGIDPSRMVIDPNFQALFGHMDSGVGGDIGLPWDGVLDGRGMVYVWNPSAAGDPLTAVEELMTVEGLD